MLFLCIQVVFKTPVSLKKHPKVNEWLTCVEKEMRMTLASLLAEAMKDVSLFQSENIDSQKYLEWVDKYQVTQVVIFSVLFLLPGLSKLMQSLTKSYS